MAERRTSEPFIEDADRFPPDNRKKNRRPPSPAQDARRRKAQQRRRRNSVFQYIAILFMAAFVLLLYTFMMERRQNQQQIDDLKQSASTVQTRWDQMDENGQLKEEVQGLKHSQEDLEQKLKQAEGENQETEQELSASRKTVEAMTWFWELNDAYVRGRFNQCRELIAGMEEAEVVGLLPRENSTGTDHLSPADRYEEIHNRVIK